MTKNIYEIEHKILALAKNAVHDKRRNSYNGFPVDGITLERWEYNIRDGWLEDAWLAKAEISANDFLAAINMFRKKLSKIVPRIALISQSYIEYQLEPHVVHKIATDTAFFQNMSGSKSGGLSFTEKEKQALDDLLTNKKVPDAFYFYWNDAVNTIGYSAKLLLMIPALEALVKKPSGKDWVLLQNILGEELKKDLFGTKDRPNTGLRHRLVHGEYFSPELDGSKNYFELVHQKIISYFNREILSKPCLQEVVVNPQRHLYGSKSEWHAFIKRTDNATFKLKDVLKEVIDDPAYAGFRDNTKYEVLDAAQFNELLKTY